ncbi:hypothetical protein ILYODFUR_024631 [Ilyodon furcidens]|uniref:Uncharacterized protein n=1 Tax=Ilyodon furcidens TaxID=33524 RepID=A0ABV0U9V5_9TELE
MHADFVNDHIWVHSYAEAFQELSSETISLFVRMCSQKRISNGGPLAGHCGDKNSSKGRQDIVHFVWVKCVCICATCLTGLLDDRSTFSAWLCSLISSDFPRGVPQLTGPALPGPHSQTRH